MTRTIIDHEARFHEVFDHAAGRTHVDGASYEPSVHDLLQREQTLRRISAELHAHDLLEALKAALAGAPHWRFEGQRLLERIARGEMKEPTP